MPPQRRRYREYLRDRNAVIPRTTAWRNRVAAAAFHRRLQEENGEPVREQSSESSSASSGEDRAPTPNNDDPSSHSDSSSENSNVAVAGGIDSNVEESSSSSSSEESNADDAAYDSDAEVEFNHEHEDGEDEADPDQANFFAADGFANIEGARGPALYQGCPLSVMESDILVMSFVVRWGLEDKSIEDLLQLIDCHLPCSVMKSKYLFLERFPVPNFSKVRFTCPECFCLVPDNFEQGECESCHTLLLKKQLKDNGNFFIELSVKEQLKQIIESESLHRLLRRQCEERDVISGMFYQYLRTDRVLRENDFTLQWNTDGVSPFKTSKAQVWPIQACLNELPFHARRENMILCGLYFGKGKPHFDSFLKPFVDQLESLHNEGFDCVFPGQEVPTRVKVHTILSSVDSVARAPLQGIKQFNGSYGCSFCLHRGMRIDRGNGSTRVYAGNKRGPRTVAQHYNAIQELEEYNRIHRRKKKHVQGVKNATQLLRLPIFNICYSFVPDYMHCILEGVVKQFINHWSDGTFRGSQWYIGRDKQTCISQKLLAIKPPVEVTRAPRSLDQLKLMTASEFRHFLLYYSLPCLHGILPNKYLQHWFLLVFAMTIYLKENFSAQEEIQAKQAICKFFEEIMTLYPDCLHLYTFNVHLLLHLPRAVKSFGALWASSTFPYEHFNGVLSRLITGTRYIPEHICSSYMRLRQIGHLGETVFSHPDCSVKGKNLYKSLTSKYRTSQFSRLSNEGLRLFGSGDIYELSLVEKVAAQHLLGNNYEVISNAHSFRRMIYKGTVYHAQAYEALRVRNNSVVKLVDGRLIVINRIVLVIKRNYMDQTCIVIGNELQVLDEILFQDRELNITCRNMLLSCRRRNQIVCALPRDISRKCVAIPTEDAIYISPLVNLLERD